VKEIIGEVCGNFHIAQQVEQEVSNTVHIGDMKMFLVAYDSGSLPNSCIVLLLVMQIRHI
jgi:hypothetical protein